MMTTFYILPKNCHGGGGAPGAPVLDPPLFAHKLVVGLKLVFKQVLFQHGLQQRNSLKCK